MTDQLAAASQADAEHQRRLYRCVRGVVLLDQIAQDALCLLFVRVDLVGDPLAHTALPAHCKHLAGIPQGETAQGQRRRCDWQ